MWRNILFVAFFACLATAFFLNNRMMKKLRNPNDKFPVQWAIYPTLRMLGSPKFYGFILCVFAGLAIVLTLKGKDDPIGVLLWFWK